MCQLGCDSGLKISNSFFAPEAYLKDRYLGDFYANHLVMSRYTMVPVGALCGFSKPFLFPVISAIGVVVLPIIALLKLADGHRNDKPESIKNGKDCLKAWAFSILGVGATIAFLAITAYFIPLVWSSALFLSFTVVSVSVHVYLMAKEPPASQPSLIESN